MSKDLTLVIAIVILTALVAIFFISFVAYRKTPMPKGCENLKMDQEKCASCSNESCMFHKKVESEDNK